MGIRSFASAQRRKFSTAALAYARWMSEAYVRSSDIARLLEIIDSAEAADNTEVFYSEVLRGLGRTGPLR